MARPSIFHNAKVTLVQAALASGTSNPASSYVDMSGFDGVAFIGSLGTAGTGATATLTAQHSTATGSTTFVSISTGSAQIASTGGLDDKFLLLDVYRPQKRYVKTLLTRGTSNVEYGGTIAIQYGKCGKLAVTHSTSTQATTPVFHDPQTT